MAVVREKLLTASDLATLCEVDLKTIHNWVDRGRIAHFRTPGRHLRFREADVAGFLRTWGYSVPRELARRSARTALVVGSKETAAHVSRALGDGLPVRHAGHPYDALVYAGASPADIYVVDIKEGGKDIDVDAMLEAIHRASGHAAIVVLTDETTPVPAFASRAPRNDVQALRDILLPGEAAPSASGSLVEEGPRALAASGGAR